ncbi:Crp/Fnr family transcriptional regulator [Dubosiella newyorkensis]|uniref:Crp/Fnr family transcriptional regulator n=1 Tax=Dubosiella newyorkensis TaxID=1862672 RepID=UPI0034E4EF89|nr:winged helix-turn-helix domain-containing protein [Dubosiella newyorkensis]
MCCASLCLKTKSFPNESNTHLKKRSEKKVLSYLSAQKKEGWFTIPFNREQMASYLNVERSALSKELGKMKKEGLINFHRNRFCLLKKKIQN